MSGVARVTIGLLVAAGCVAIVVIGQRTVGWGSFGLMALGLSGLIVLLAIYNRKYR